MNSRVSANSVWARSAGGISGVVDASEIGLLQFSDWVKAIWESWQNGSAIGLSGQRVHQQVFSVNLGHSRSRFQWGNHHRPAPNG